MAGLRTTFLSELLRDSHRYVPGHQQHVSADRDPLSRTMRRGVRAAVEHVRDAAERSASSLGFTHAHFDADTAGARLAQMMEAFDAYEMTYRALADEHSRRTLLDVLKLRVLGPYHVDLALKAGAVRAAQRRVETTLREDTTALCVEDPIYPRLHRYRIPVAGQEPIRLYSHSGLVVSIFELDQYRYAHAADVAPRAGDVVVDAGACWGETALHFASLVGDGGFVYAFEPSPANVAVLRRNLELNPRLAERIEIVEAALWRRSEEALGLDEAGQATTVLSSARAGAATSAWALDDFVAARGVEPVDFVKMDVEGAELAVLQGGRETLARHAPRLAIAAYHRDEDLVSFASELARVPAYELFLDHFSAGDHETILFAAAT